MGATPAGVPRPPRGDVDSIGILAIGQSPRPDFERIFRRALPETHLIVRGALDRLSQPEIEALAASGGPYPLFTILRDGSTREISLFPIARLLETCVTEVAAAGASIVVVMCAGDFPDLQSPIPVLYPGRILPAVARGVCRTDRLGIVVPNAAQVESAVTHWRTKGFAAHAAVASPLDPAALDRAAESLRALALELIVLDCLGFPPEAARRVRGLCGGPVLCPQGLVPRIVAEMLGA